MYNGKCEEILKSLPDNSVDSIVTDPPYELGFMGKSWDSTGIAYNMDMWKECLRVLKPGGHLLAFGGTRTYHRMACAIEDAGFEIRDQIQWIYGSGFPKSLDIGKAIDKHAGSIGHSILDIKREIKKRLTDKNISIKEFNKLCGFEASGYLRESSTWECVLPSSDKWIIMKSVLNCGDELDALFQEAEREIIGESDSGLHRGSGITVSFGVGNDYSKVPITAPSTPEAKQWQGWGTALKPANEPICMARKPLSEKTVAENVLKWGTGGINIDGCRIEYEEGGSAASNPLFRSQNGYKINHGADVNATSYQLKSEPGEMNINPSGRFPANLILDESAAEMLDEQSGGASRFFYCAKAAKKEKGKDNIHPTVKPVKLMEYLVKLVTPKGGTCLDPFTGSGTTGVAAINQGYRFVGIESETTYCDITISRIQHIESNIA